MGLSGPLERVVCFPYHLAGRTEFRCPCPAVPSQGLTRHKASLDAPPQVEAKKIKCLIGVESTQQLPLCTCSLDLSSSPLPSPVFL